MVAHLHCGSNDFVVGALNVHVCCRPNCLCVYGFKWMCILTVDQMNFMITALYGACFTATKCV